MPSCDGVRPLLSHVVEGELTPDEAMRVARHLSDCTACKIVLARERRLAEMLERDLEDLPVGEEFVRSVMETLPQGPPPRRRGRRNWRGLKLAGSVGLLGAGALTVSQWLSAGRGGVARIGLPATDFETGPSGLENLAGLARLATGALEALRDLTVALPSVGGGAELLAAAVTAVVVCVGAGSVLFAVAAGSLARTSRCR
jgi:anti-sigma factor RsiW